MKHQELQQHQSGLLPAGWNPRGSNSSPGLKPLLPCCWNTRGSNPPRLGLNLILPAGWHTKSSNQEIYWSYRFVTLLRYVFHKECNGTSSCQDNPMCLSDVFTNQMAGDVALF